MQGIAQMLWGVESLVRDNSPLGHTNLILYEAKTQGPKFQQKQVPIGVCKSSTEQFWCQKKWGLLSVLATSSVPTPNLKKILNLIV